MGWFRGLQRLPLWGRGTALAVDAGMQVAGTALCDVLLCTIHHQSPTLRMFSRRENAAGRRRPVQLSPKGSPKNCLRRRLLLLLALAFLLTSCAHGAPRAPQIPADFAASVEVVRGDFTYALRRRRDPALHRAGQPRGAARRDGGRRLHPVGRRRDGDCADGRHLRAVCAV